MDDLNEKLTAIMELLTSIDERLPPAVASVAQIRGQYGDPKINFDPKSWKGSSYKGRKASESEPDFLDAYAETLEYFARNPDPSKDPKYIGYNRKDAKLCRRWALEMREGKAPSKKPSATSNQSLFGETKSDKVEDDLPF